MGGMSRALVVVEAYHRASMERGGALKALLAGVGNLCHVKKKNYRENA
jgi:hypothetical protein